MKKFKKKAFVDGWKNNGNQITIKQAKTFKNWDQSICMKKL